MRIMIGDTALELTQGDITREATDAIVNAANASLMGGGGVDGAIHATGGAQILVECKAIVDEVGPLPPGGVVITTGGTLAARYVIHTVGPIWAGGQSGEAEILASCYQNTLTLAVEKGLRSIAYPSISTGAYRFPVDQAARIALETVLAFLRKNSPPLESLRFVLFSEKDSIIYENTLEELL